MFKNFLAEPTWMRMGFPSPPDEITSGKGIGIIIIDNVINHPEISHLRGRLKKITVNRDFSITYSDIVSDEPEVQAPYKNSAEHGMMSLFLLSHKPFEIDNKRYVGLVPAATFLVLSTYEPQYIKRGIEWIIQRCEDWNVQVVLSMFPRYTGGAIVNSKEDPYVQALMPAIEAGILVVSANGNSPSLNDYQPIEFLAVGGYDDGGYSDLSMRKPHPSTSWGINGDGHMRPDILAPFSYLPAPYYEVIKSDLYSPFFDASRSKIKLSYFAGTSGASTLIAGLCVYLLSKYRNLHNSMLRDILIHYGVTIRNTNNPAPSVHVGQIIEALSKGCKDLHGNNNFNYANSLLEEMQEGKLLTSLIKQGKYTRVLLWEYACNKSARAKKVAIWTLGKPIDINEKMKAWEYFYKSEDDGSGVRESWAYMILNGSEKEDLDRWMSIIDDKSTDIRLCVKIFLNKYYPNVPELEHTPDFNSNTISEIVQPVLKWYNTYKDSNFIG